MHGPLDLLLLTASSCDAAKIIAPPPVFQPSQSTGIKMGCGEKLTCICISFLHCLLVRPGMMIQ